MEDFGLSPFCDFYWDKGQREREHFFMTGMCKSTANGKIRNAIFKNNFTQKLKI